MTLKSSIMPSVINYFLSSDQWCMPTCLETAPLSRLFICFKAGLIPPPMSKMLSLIYELDLKLGQYTKVPPRMTFAAQMVRIIILMNAVSLSSFFFSSGRRALLLAPFSISLVSQDAPHVAIADKGVSVMKVIVGNNRAALRDPIGTRIVRQGFFGWNLLNKSLLSGADGSYSNTILRQWQWVCSERTFFLLENLQDTG